MEHGTQPQARKSKNHGQNNRAPPINGRKRNRGRFPSILKMEGTKLRSQARGSTQSTIRTPNRSSIRNGVLFEVGQFGQNHDQGNLDDEGEQRQNQPAQCLCKSIYAGLARGINIPARGYLSSRNRYRRPISGNRNQQAPISRSNMDTYQPRRAHRIFRLCFDNDWIRSSTQ